MSNKISRYPVITHLDPASDDDFVRPVEITAERWQEYYDQQKAKYPFHESLIGIENPYSHKIIQTAEDHDEFLREDSYYLLCNDITSENLVAARFVLQEKSQKMGQQMDEAKEKIQNAERQIQKSAKILREEESTRSRLHFLYRALIAVLLVVFVGVGIYLRNSGYQEGKDAGSAISESERSLLISNGYDEGREAGLEEGYQNGYEEGQAAGYDKGFSEGRDQGYESALTQFENTLNSSDYMSFEEWLSSRGIPTISSRREEWEQMKENKDPDSDSTLLGDDKEALAQWALSQFGNGGNGSFPSYDSTPLAQTYIGNKNSKVFHLPTCSSLPAQKNQVLFNSREEAINAGYRPCQRCNP